MSARFRSFVVLGLASAALAAAVPGVFEPARPQAPVRIAETPIISIPHVAPASTIAVQQPATPVVIQPRRRSVVPTGCERLVSPLARSAASSTASRCIT